MTNKSEQLLELAGRVEALAGPCREVDFLIAEAVSQNKDHWAGCRVRAGDPVGYPDDYRRGKWEWSQPFYTANIEAVETLLPSWAFPLLDWNGSHCRLRNSLGIDFNNYTGLATSPTRAMLAAILRAIAAQGDEKP